MAPPIPSPESSRDVTPALKAAVDSTETRLQALKTAQSIETHAAGGVHAGKTAEVLKKADEAKAALALAATTAGIPPESSAVFTSDIPATPAAPQSTPSTGTTEASTSGKAATPETHTPAAAAAPAQAPATPNPNEGAGGGGQSSPERAPARPNEGAGGAPQTSPTGGAEGAPPATPAAPAETPAPAEQKPKKGFLATFTEFFEKFSEKIGKLFEGLVEKLFGKKKEPEAAASAAPAAATGPEVLAGPDTTVGLTGQALVNNPQFLARTEQVVSNIGVGVTRDDLLTMMNFETARTMDPKIKNPHGSASGLIQFIEPTAKGLGTSTAELRNMSGLKQLDYVEQYFKNVIREVSPISGKLNGFSDLYRAIFWPAAIGKGPEYIFASRSQSAAYIVSQNPGFAKDYNGFITNRSFEVQCSKMRANFAIAPQPTTPKPNS